MYVFHWEAHLHDVLGRNTTANKCSHGTDRFLLHKLNTVKKDAVEYVWLSQIKQCITKIKNV